MSAGAKETSTMPNIGHAFTVGATRASDVRCTLLKRLFPRSLCSICERQLNRQPSVHARDPRGARAQDSSARARTPRASTGVREALFGDRRRVCEAVLMQYRLM